MYGIFTCIYHKKSSKCKYTILMDSINGFYMDPITSILYVWYVTICIPSKRAAAEPRSFLQLGGFCSEVARAAAAWELKKTRAAAVVKATAIAPKKERN